MPVGMFTDVKHSQEENVYVSIDVIVFGNDTLCNLVQPLKTDDGSATRGLSTTALFKPVQLLKRLCPIVVRVLGTVISVKDLHAVKHSFPMDVSVLGNVIFCKE